jgi:hypothetical protein
MSTAVGSSAAVDGPAEQKNPTVRKKKKKKGKGKGKGKKGQSGKCGTVARLSQGQRDC